MQASTMRNTFTAKRSAKMSGKGKRVKQVKLTKHWREPTELFSPVVKLTNVMGTRTPRITQALLTKPNQLNLARALAGAAIPLLTIRREV